MGRLRATTRLLIGGWALISAAPMAAQQVDSVAKGGAGAVRCLMEGLYVKDDLTGGAPLLSWLRFTSAAPIMGSLLGEGLVSSGAPRHEGVSLATMRRRSAGDSIIQELTIDSIPSGVGSRWQFAAVPPFRLPTGTWGKQGMPILEPYGLGRPLGPDSLREPPEVIGPHLRYPTLHLPMLVPPSLAGKAEGSVWADTVNLTIERKLNSLPTFQETFRSVTTWRMLGGDTLAVDQVLWTAMTRKSVASGEQNTFESGLRSEVAALFLLDEQQRVQWGLVAERSTTSATLDSESSNWASDPGTNTPSIGLGRITLRRGQ